MLSLYDSNVVFLSPTPLPPKDQLHLFFFFLTHLFGLGLICSMQDLFFFFFLSYGIWDVVSLPGIKKPRPSAWDREDLTTGPPAKSLHLVFNFLIFRSKCGYLRTLVLAVEPGQI